MRTSEPRARLHGHHRAEAVSLEPAEPVDEPEFRIPAEAFVRLVYGRLDPGHTPTTHGP